VKGASSKTFFCKKLKSQSLPFSLCPPHRRDVFLTIFNTMNLLNINGLIHQALIKTATYQVCNPNGDNTIHHRQQLSRFDQLIHKIQKMVKGHVLFRSWGNLRWCSDEFCRSRQGDTRRCILWLLSTLHQLWLQTKKNLKESLVVQKGKI